MSRCVKYKERLLAVDLGGKAFKTKSDFILKNDFFLVSGHESS